MTGMNLTEVTLCDEETMIRAASARRTVITTHGTGTLIRWNTKRDRNRARIRYSPTRTLTVPTRNVLQVDLSNRK
jgi:hypothetical protein